MREEGMEGRKSLEKGQAGEDRRGQAQRVHPCREERIWKFGGSTQADEQF